jgi:hypothetical protein
MAEYIEKHKAVNLLTALENEFQQFKPFKGFEHAMYRKLCETEIAIGKLPAADVAPAVRAHWIEQDGMQICSNCGEEHTWDDFRAAYCDCCGAKMDGSADNG